VRACVHACVYCLNWCTYNMTVFILLLVIQKLFVQALFEVLVIMQVLCRCYC